MHCSFAFQKYSLKSYREGKVGPLGSIDVEIFIAPAKGNVSGAGQWIEFLQEMRVDVFNRNDDVEMYPVAGNENFMVWCALMPGRMSGQEGKKQCEKQIYNNDRKDRTEDFLYHVEKKTYSFFFTVHSAVYVSKRLYNRFRVLIGCFDSDLQEKA